jgi:hypothetical protein
MTRSPLARFAGPIAISAAALVIVTRIVSILSTPADLQELRVHVVQTTHAVNSVASILAFALLIVALFALYEHQARPAGILGAVGVGAAAIGTVFMAGDWWYEAFAVPWMADIAPAAFETGAAGSLLIGGLASFALFAAGWVLFAVASLRAGVFPKAISATILIGGLVSGLPINGAYLLGNVILGLGIGWLGIWIMSPQAAPAAAEPSATPA